MDHEAIRNGLREGDGMTVSDAGAEGVLAAPVRRADARDQMIPTFQDRVILSAPMVPMVKPEAERERITMAIRKAGRAKAIPGPSAARSQDFLYDEDGLPA